MPQEIEFSIMAPNASGIQPLLEQFEAQHGIHVRVRLLAWDSAWSLFVRSALYGDGPDVSEVGTTWIGDLIGMNALRPFDAADLASLGKASAFFPAAWRTARQYGDARVWSIPWLTGSRLVFYRPGLLSQAGVDAATAFGSVDAFEKTVCRLYDSGVRLPLTLPTGYTHTTLLNIASWVWAAGGDFLSEDGRSTRFMEPEAVAGMAAYFRLARYLSPEVRHLNALQPDDLFLANPDVALTISGPWLFCQAARETTSGKPEDLKESMRVALPPGASFVGGSNLIVWKYSRDPVAALKLVRFLTRTASQVAYCPQVGLLPAREKALGLEPFSTDIFWQTAVQGLKTGKSFPLMRLWGLVEDRLTAGLSAVWSDVLQDSTGDPRQVVLKHLEPIARRLDRVLESA